MFTRWYNAAMRRPFTLVSVLLSVPLFSFSAGCNEQPKADSHPSIVREESPPAPAAVPRPQPVPLPLASPPIIQFQRFVELKTDKGKKYWVARYRVTNASEQAVWFWGYSKEHPFLETCDQINGRWVNRGPRYCGTGQQRPMLSPGESADFDEWLSRGSTAMVTGIMFFADPRGAEPTVVWGNTVPVPPPAATQP